MKAITQEKAGEAEELKVTENVPKPQLKERDLLVKLTAAAVNPVDYKARKGYKGWFNADILGFDGVGIVEDVGTQVKNFKKGDKVYFAGDITRNGSYAEYTAIDERIVAYAPSKLTDLESAVVPLVALTAWEAFEERMKIPIQVNSNEKPSKSILIIGGAGGVGSFAIQLAKKVFNLIVIATASREESVNYCKELGSDFVINHNKDMVEQVKAIGFENGVNYLFCCSDAHNSWESWPNLLSVFGHATLITSQGGLAMGAFQRKSITVSTEMMFTKSMFGVELESQGKILTQVAKLLDEGILKHNKKQEFPLRDIIKAHKQIESGTTIGKIALRIEF